MIPKNNGGGSLPITLTLESSTDKTLGAPAAAPGTGTPIFYESVQPDNQLTFQGTQIVAHISSKVQILTGHTYAANVFLAGQMLVPTVTGLVSDGNNNLSIAIDLPQGVRFPANTPVQIVLYQSS